MTEDLCFSSARELASRIRKGELSPVTVVDAYLERIDELNDELNAYVTVLPEQARSEAKEAEAAVENNSDLGPLHGVPVAIKDLNDVAGVTTTFGSPALADYVPDTDDTAVERLRDAGAIVLGKTNTPEFGRKTVTDNPVFGESRNPWDTSKVTGGSSGGSAAAVAAGLAPVALGTDAAGSIRIPSSACGVVGFMPDFGRVPFGPVRADAFENELPYTFTGPITRTVGDAALLLDVMAGRDSADPYSIPRPTESYRSALDGTLDGLEIGYAPEFGDFEVASAVESTVGDGLDQLAAAGASVSTVELSFENDWETRHEALERLLQARYVGLYRNVARDFDVDLLTTEEPITPEVRSRIRKGIELDTETLATARRVRTETFDAIRSAFDDVDVLVTPTLGRTAFDLTEDAPTVDGTAVHSMHGWTLTWPLNLSGHPACSVPVGTVDGLPVGMQVIGRRHDDRSVMKSCAAMEAVLNWQAMYPPSRTISQ